MTIEQAFKHLVKGNWFNQDKKFKEKYKVYKSRFLNIYGNHEKGVSQDKMREMLLHAKYKENWTEPIKKKKD
jgi:hypothetical protein